MLRRLVVSGALNAVIFPAGTAYASCDVHAGDDLLAWVNNRAGTLSRQLTSADYTAREQGIFMGTLDESNRRLVDASSRLQAALDRTNSFETRAASANPTDAAILREKDAQDLLNELLSIQALLSDIRTRQDGLGVAPTAAWMKLNGLQNVGRATFLASFNQLGDDSRDSLRERYSISFKVTFDENGNAQNASGGLNQTGDWDDAVASSVVNYYPYGTAAAIFYEAIKFVVSENECQAKIDEQTDKARQAYNLLPNVLIGEQEQIADMTSAYVVAKQSFGPTLALSIAYRQKLEDEWKAVFTYNAERIDAAHAVLTADKVAAIQRAFGSGSHLDSLLEGGAIIKLASDIGVLNADLARRQSLVIGSCADVRGAEAVEDQVDSLKDASSIYDALGVRTGFAPLAPLLASSQGVTKDRSDEAIAVRGNLAARTCMRHPPNVALPFPVASKDQPNSALIAASKREAAVRRRTPAPEVLKGLTIVQANARFLAAAGNQDVAGSLLCSLTHTDGGDWSCNGGGESYDSSLDNTAGVAGGANDGGYAADNRRVQSEISAATQNILQRISQLQSEAQRVNNALPEWRDKNATALQQYQAQADVQTADTIDARAGFATDNASQLSSAKQSLDDFLSSPFDSGKTQQLITKVGGSQLDLPGLTSDVMVPDLPTVSGITASDRLFGPGTSIADRRAMREGDKDSLELGGTSAGALAQRDLAMAKRFSDHQTQASQAIAQVLLGDAKSLRYAKSGEIPHAGYSTSNRGQLGRSDLGADGVPPANSILARGEGFEASNALLRQRADAIMASLKPGDANYSQRENLVQTATAIDGKATEAFFSGDLDDGERAQRAAFAVLDLATRFVPGVNWGRDVYEAVTGKDLFTDAPLGDVARTMAVLGAVTAGVASEAGGVVHTAEELEAIEKLADVGVSGEKAQEILEAAAEINGTMDLTVQEYATGRALQRDIDGDAVDAALNTGTRFWTPAKDSMLVVEEAPGVTTNGRAAVAVDIKNPSQMEAKTFYYTKESDAALLEKTITQDAIDDPKNAIHGMQELLGKKYYVKIPTPFDVAP